MDQGSSKEQAIEYSEKSKIFSFPQSNEISNRPRFCNYFEDCCRSASLRGVSRLQQLSFDYMSSPAVKPIAFGSLKEVTLPEGVGAFPKLRYMGSKYRLLPWIHGVLREFPFQTALDAFSGSGCVSYLLKRMGKQVCSNDFLTFAHQISSATIENSTVRLEASHLAALLVANRNRKKFIQRTFDGVFYTPEDLRFLDNIWANLESLPCSAHRALTIAALTRACVKKQPRGVFTITGNLQHYDDGRRDLRLSLKQLFIESVDAYNEVIFCNGQENSSVRSDIFELKAAPFDLVYLDPPYVPRADDNCYIKRYHFVEGLASYWQGMGTEIMVETTSKKLAKRFTPFSYKKTSIGAFTTLFERFKHSTIVLSYSSNGYPDLQTLVTLLRKSKSKCEVFEKPHRYHFGTHQGVSPDRSAVSEYLIVGY